MSLVSRILEHSRNARAPRARDPETHEAIPYGTEQPALVRIGAWMLKTSWVERAVLKWSAAITTALTAWLLGKGAGDHTEVIVAGVAAALTFAYEQIASYLTSKATMKIPPRVGGQSLAQPAIPFTSDSGRSFTFDSPGGPVSDRSAMFKAIIAKPTSPAEDRAALLELRESLLKPAPSMPPAAEQEATLAKLYGFSVEVDGEVHDFIDKFAAIQFRNNARADGKRATLLF